MLDFLSVNHSTLFSKQLESDKSKRIQSAMQYNFYT